MLRGRFTFRHILSLTIGSIPRAPPSTTPPPAAAATLAQLVSASPALDIEMGGGAVEAPNKTYSPRAAKRGGKEKREGDGASNVTPPVQYLGTLPLTTRPLFAQPLAAVTTKDNAPANAVSVRVGDGNITSIESSSVSLSLSSANFACCDNMILSGELYEGEGEGEEESPSFRSSCSRRRSSKVTIICRLSNSGDECPGFVDQDIVDETDCSDSVTDGYGDDAVEVRSTLSDVMKYADPAELRATASMTGAGRRSSTDEKWMQRSGKDSRESARSPSSFRPRANMHATVDCDCDVHRSL